MYKNNKLLKEFETENKIYCLKKKNQIHSSTGWP